MSRLSIKIGTVREIENEASRDGYGGLRVRAEIGTDKAKNISDIPWAFPLLPKTFQSIPKIGEAVFVIMDDDVSKVSSQRYFLGPIISQPQYNTYCAKKNATSLLNYSDRLPIGQISSVDDTRGSFPKANDVAVVGRGAEDIILRFDDATKCSELDLRTGIRSEPTNSHNQDMIGNIIFNGTDPAYIQLKYKKGLATHEDNAANSVINIVANRVNIMSNKDANISHDINDKDMLVKEEKMDEIMDSLHQVPMGDKLVELLTLMKDCIMHHVHPWAGMEQCGDWGGYINKLNAYDIESILSKYVRIS